MAYIQANKGFSLAPTFELFVFSCPLSDQSGEFMRDGYSAGAGRNCITEI